MHRFTAITIALCLLGAAQLGAAQQAEAKGRITFFTSSQVEADRVTVDDIARLEGFGDKALKEALRQVDLGQAPRPTASRTLSRPLIESALKQVGLPPNVRVVYPKTIKIHRPGQQIAPAAFASKAHAAIEALATERWGNDHTIALDPPKIRTALVVPKGAWTVRAQTRTDDAPLGATMITLQVIIDGREVSARPTSVKIKVTGPICHATRPIKRGEILARSDLAQVQGPLTRGLLGCKAALGKEAKGSVRADTPLKASQLQPPRLVKRGDQVTIVFASGGLRIVAEGEAMKDGAAGEWIPVSNLGSKRVIRAQVSGLGKVQIE